MNEDQIKETNQMSALIILRLFEGDTDFAVTNPYLFINESAFELISFFDVPKGTSSANTDYEHYRYLKNGYLEAVHTAYYDISFSYGLAGRLTHMNVRNNKKSKQFIVKYDGYFVTEISEKRSGNYYYFPDITFTNIGDNTLLRFYNHRYRRFALPTPAEFLFDNDRNIKACDENSRKIIERVDDILFTKEDNVISMTMGTGWGKKTYEYYLNEGNIHKIRFLGKDKYEVSYEYNDDGTIKTIRSEYFDEEPDYNIYERKVVYTKYE